MCVRPGEEKCRVCVVCPLPSDESMLCNSSFFCSTNKSDFASRSKEKVNLLAPEDRDITAVVHPVTFYQLDPAKKVTFSSCIKTAVMIIVTLAPPGGDAQAKHPSVWLPCTMQGMVDSSLAPGMPRTLSTKTRAAAGGLLAYTCPDRYLLTHVLNHDEGIQGVNAARKLISLTKGYNGRPIFK